jgi:hypothetical protein
MMNQHNDSLGNERRRFLKLMSGSALLPTGHAAVNPESGGNAQSASKKEEEVSPAEDLMREHGVLKRALRIYGEALRRIEANEELPHRALPDSAKIIRSFLC